MSSAVLSPAPVATPAKKPAPVANPATEMHAVMEGFLTSMESVASLKPLARMELARLLGESASLPVGKAGIGRPSVALYLAAHAALNGASVTVAQEFARNANSAAKAAGKGLPFRRSAKGQGASGNTRWALNAPASMELAD